MKHDNALKKNVSAPKNGHGKKPAPIQTEPQPLVPDALRQTEHASEPGAAQAAPPGDPRLQRAQRQAHVMHVAQLRGNRHVSRLMQSQVQRKYEGASRDPADQKAMDVYDALDGWNNEAKALAGLQSPDAGVRQQIQTHFQERYDKPLKTYLKEQLSSNWLVKSYALLNSGNYLEPHTGLAEALIPLGTRDEEFFRILDGMPLTARQATEKKYNETFAEIGKGSLRADMKDDLSGWRLQKSMAMLDRDLNSADALYFDSVGITGTHDDSVVKRFQEEWAQGPQRFAAFDKEWHDYVMNEKKWTTEETWTTMPLDKAMSDELSGENWELVKAVLDAYKGASAKGLTGAGPLNDEQQEQLEDLQLKEANDRLTAATTGGYTGLGTNEDQVYTAVEQIRKIWKTRIARAEAKKDPLKLQDVNSLWAIEKARLLKFLPDEMDKSSADYKRTRILLEGNLTPADEVWLAKQDNADEKVVSLVTKYWAMGQLDTLFAEARKKRTVTEGGKEVELRDAFTVAAAVPSAKGVLYKQLASLAWEDTPDAVRGAQRLKVEMDQGTDESDLQKVYQFLSTDGLGDGLRNAVIEKYVNTNLGGVANGKPGNKFLDTLKANGGENKNSYWKLMNLIDPTRDPNEVVRRAQGQQKANKPGIFGGLITGTYDVATGEESQQVTDDSLKRLEYIAKMGASDAELQAMMALTGAASKEELVEKEAKNFQSRLDEVRAIKHAVTEAIATAVELAIEVALTVATGGAGAAMLVGSLAAAVAGMLIREAALGEDYDLISTENAKKLALTVASAGFGAGTKTLTSEILTAEKLAKLGKVGVFMKEAATDAATQFQVSIVSAALNDHMPTTDDIAAGAITILGSAVASGTGATIKLQISQNSSAVQKLRTNVIADVSQNVISGVADESGNLVKTGIGDQTGAQIAGNFGTRAAKDIGKGVTTAVASSLAESRGKKPGPENENADGKAGGDKVPSKSSRDGKHELKYTKNGHIFICSWPCEFLESRYAGELASEPTWQAQLEALKKKSPEEALDGAVELEAKCRAKRNAAFKGMSDEEIDNALGDQKLVGGDVKPIKTSRRPEDRVDIARTDPNTGKPLEIDPATGQPKVVIDPKTGKPLSAIDPVSGKPIGGQSISRDAAHKAVKLLGQKVSTVAAVKQAWDTAAAAVVARNGALSADNYAAHYKSTVEPFWRNVFDDAAAKAYFESYGFKFYSRGSAPLLEAAVGAPVNADEYRISLDHIAPKATGSNWQQALDATNLQFVTHADNRNIQNLEERHPDLKRP